MELLRGGQPPSVCWDHLAFLLLVHELDSCQRAAGGAEGFESEHGTNDLFHCTMILFHQVVEPVGWVEVRNPATAVL